VQHKASGIIAIAHLSAAVYIWEYQHNKNKQEQSLGAVLTVGAMEE
jgi:hypothetical protein